MYKVYVEDRVFVDNSLEIKVGYLNINNLTAEFHAEYVNFDINLQNLDILALADTRLGVEQMQIFCKAKLDNFKVLKGFDTADGSKHMGMVLLLSRTSSFEKLIPKDLIECFEESKETKSGQNKGKMETFFQGCTLWVQEHYVKVCFIYFREKPTGRELFKASQNWKDCDLIMGDFNLKPNISADLRLLKHICGSTHILPLNEMTTVHGQPDHIILHKQFEKLSFSTCYLNFISDHQSIVTRISLTKSPFDAEFLQKIKFDSEKHLKKLEAEKKVLKMEKEEEIKLPERKESNNKTTNVNIEKLQGNTWLDDTIINEYGRVLKDQYKQSVFVFSSHFLEQLTNHGYKGVKRWDKNVNIFEKKFVFYPLFENYHWFLAVQDNNLRTISILEPYVPLDEVIHPPKQRQFNPSLRKVKNKRLDLIVKNHQERLFFIYNHYILPHQKLPSEFSLEMLVTCAPDIPHQSNSNDCGVFLLAFMKYITQGKSFDFSCMDMSNFRQEIKEEIENKQIKEISGSSILRFRGNQQENSQRPTAMEDEAYKTKESLKPHFKEETNEVDEFNECKILKFTNPPRKNLCFSNAVTTVLMNIPGLKDILRDENTEKHNDNEILIEMKRLFKLKNLSRSSTQTLRRTVQEVCLTNGQVMRMFNNNNQHDAAEFLNSVLEHLSRNDQDDISINEQLFGGLSQKTMFCSNSSCNMSEQLQVEILGEIIPVEFSGYTIESCLGQFFNTEEIERKCKHCGCQRSAQATSFIREPKTLIIQLNRFRFSQDENRVVKIHEPLIFPTEIQLPSGSSYKILSTINHIGELADSGHYTCLLMDKATGTYSLINDSSVIPSVTITEELSQQVYLLVYDKQGKLISIHNVQ